jgi:hypothetical protein
VLEPQGWFRCKTRINDEKCGIGCQAAASTGGYVLLKLFTHPLAVAFLQVLLFAAFSLKEGNKRENSLRGSQMKLYDTYINVKTFSYKILNVFKKYMHLSIKIAFLIIFRIVKKV